MVSCVACSPTDNNTGAIEATPTLITLEENLGGIKGVYQSNMQDNVEQLIAFAAPYLGDPESEGVFIFSGNMETSALIDKTGNFQIANLTPGFYILLIGPNVKEAEIHQSNGKAVKIEVLAGEYIDIGIIN